MIRSSSYILKQRATTAERTRMPRRERRRKPAIAVTKHQPNQIVYVAPKLKAA